ncbi:hypothetical protein M569_08541 [Genlisea aurea]|uniref:Pentatricopeptide repeat-containing protein n=1 Tax=Genlisea aurea TaxID=192259 RepID=S8CH99_9LAMI|nr:hypothetical protein M569_08541 [Genlisea aurea]
MDFRELQSYAARLLNSFDVPSLVCRGKQLHLLFLKRGALFSTVSIANRLLQMYAKCGKMKDARVLFDEMPQRNSFAWNTLLEGYAKWGSKDELWGLFYSMPSKDDFSWNIMISEFVSEGAWEEAQQLFDEMPRKNEIAWNTMIYGHARSGRSTKALELFKKFLKWEVSHHYTGGLIMSCNPIILATAIGACSDARRVELGKQVHARIVTGNVECDPILASSLVTMYGKCGDIQTAYRLLISMEEPDDYSLSSLIFCCAKAYGMDEARRLFELKSNPSVVVWNSMISSYVSNDQPEEALHMYEVLQKQGVRGNYSTFSSVLSACSCLGSLRDCIQIHPQAHKIGVISDLLVAGAFIDAYSKCGSPADSCNLFGELKTYDTVLLNTMINIFFNCGRVDEAKRVFGGIEFKSLISWNSVIVGLSQNGYPMEALEIFRTMNDNTISMDSFSLASAISACASISLFELGEQIFGRAVVIGVTSNQVVATSLIDLYCKCGSVEFGRKLFDRLRNAADSVSWSTMLMGYASNGYGKETLALFHDMMRLGTVTPNEVTFIAVLSACDHCGLVEEGRHWFSVMRNQYRIDPTIEHYSCMIDLMSRSGLIQEAIDLIDEIPLQVDANMWSAVLRGCIQIEDKCLSEQVINRIRELDPQNSGTLVQLSGVLASTGDWNQSESVRRAMRDMRIQKSPALSWI